MFLIFARFFYLNGLSLCKIKNQTKIKTPRIVLNLTTLVKNSGAIGKKNDYKQEEEELG